MYTLWKSCCCRSCIVWRRVITSVWTPCVFLTIPATSTSVWNSRWCREGVCTDSGIGHSLWSSEKFNNWTIQQDPTFWCIHPYYCWSKFDRSVPQENELWEGELMLQSATDYSIHGSYYASKPLQSESS
jgi:hypothetical protein